MKNWQFCIGNRKIRLSSSEEEINLEIQRFQNEDPIKENENIVQINLYTTEEIGTPNGIKCNSPQEHPVWIDVTKVTRHSWDYFRKEPHMSVEYDLRSPNNIECYVHTKDLPWAISEKYLWSGVGLQYILLHNKHLIFHASYIEVDGKGIIFVAPSGTGKSTQAALWEKHRGARIINGDKACVSISENVQVHGIPFDGTSGICNNISCPLGAIVFLGQAKENTICKMPSVLAIRSLYSNIFVDRSIPAEGNKALELIIKLIEKVPVYYLKCTPDERAVEALEAVLN